MKSHNTDKFIDKKKLAWRCRRGTRELDRMTRYYLEHHYDKASTEEQKTFRALLGLPDPLLYSILSGSTKNTDSTTNKIAELIRKYCGRQIT